MIQSFDRISSLKYCNILQILDKIDTASRNFQVSLIYPFRRLLIYHSLKQR